MKEVVGAGNCGIVAGSDSPANEMRQESILRTTRQANQDYAGQEQFHPVEKKLPLDISKDKPSG